MLAFPSCIKDTYIPYRPGGEGDSIILDIASETLPLMKSEASGAEIAVDHLDVLIFEENGAYRWHERITSLNGSREGTVTLSAKREDFTAKSGYWVYLVANSSHAAADFDNIDLNGLRSMIEETPLIHLTGWEDGGEYGAPRTFLMDGVAYSAEEGSEPENPGVVVLNDGVVSNDTELKVTLRRAAAKIVVEIERGEDVQFTDSGEAGFYLSNMPWTSSVVSGVDAPAELLTPELFRYRGTPFYNWTDDVITVTTYAYAHDWADVSALENELRLVVNIPLKYNPETSADDESAGVYEGSYYQIPVSRDKVLERNTCYEVRVTVNTPGATNPSKPVTLDEIEYEVVDWTKKTINVGGEIEDAAYLSLNRYELELHNIADDETSLIFASSSPVSVTVDRVWYIDKFGQEQEYSNQQISHLVSAGADAGLNGNLTIHSDLPTNNTIRYIELTVSNKDNIDRTVVIRQYPLEYITNKQSWYSYRDDFKTRDTRPTTYEYMGDRIYGISLDSRNISSWDGGYDYEVAVNGWFTDGFSSSDSFFTSKYAVEDPRTGKSEFYYYYYDERGRLKDESLTEYNARLYHIVLTASSDKYTIGRPRQIYDEISGLYVTDPGEDNAELVSPSFMIASSLCGFLVGGGNLTLDGSDNSLRIAREHCANYVEVAKDGTVYDDWRLPTKAELDIILNFQGTEHENADAIDYLLNGDYYYHAGGRTYNPNHNVDGGEPRCVRDVYGD